MTGEEVTKSQPPSFVRQLFVCGTIFTLSMSIGAGAGFSGVVIPQLETDDGFNMDKTQISWFASLMSFATIPTCLLGGFLGEYLGRRMTCCLISPLFLAGFLCTALAPDIHLLYTGRILGGLALGLGSPPAGVLVSEVATPAWRTTFGGGLSAFYMVGMVITFILGKAVSWRVLAGICCIFPSLSIILLFFIPESPAWLVTQGRLVEARRSLQWIRGPHCQVEEEFSRLTQSYAVTQTQKSEKKNFTSKMRDIETKIKRPDVYKPLALMLVLMFTQQFSGVATLTYYAVSIMENSGSSLDKYTATIIYGVIRLLGSSLGALMMRRFARRPLLILSSLCVGLGMILLGYSTQHNSDRDPEVEDNGFVANYLPLISVNLIAVSYQLGLGPVGWSYTAELFPVDMRSFLSGLCSFATNLYIFVVIKTFPELQSSISDAGSYYFYAAIAFCAAILGLTVLPETKGKNLAEVSQYFYVCCTFGSKEEETSATEKEMLTISSDGSPVKSNSFIMRLNSESREEKDEKETRRRTIMDIDNVGTETDTMKEPEKLHKVKSAPIVKLDELENLL